ncbi:Selenoprotein Pb [Oryzias melastigma]|uniref:Selenoprotein Pb n=1 Tax=Oryzias melastigma TaxID=30732 RepID=A0A834F2G4_ORYME|nr:Selenoprotein Pb [Oryzias melastigma]
MIVNELEAHSLAMYWKLKKKAPPGVPVYQQSPLQTDVWEILDGDKDDFLIYDRMIVIISIAIIILIISMVIIILIISIAIVLIFIVNIIPTTRMMIVNTYD